MNIITKITLPDTDPFEVRVFLGKPNGLDITAKATEAEDHLRDYLESVYGEGSVGDFEVEA